MRALEIVFVATLLGFLLAQTVRGMRREYAPALAAAGWVTLVASALLEQLRLQMALGYLLFVILSALLLKRSHSHAAVRSAGVVLGVVLVATTVTLSLGLPVLALPAPDGPNVVGSTSLLLIDDSRDNALFGAPDEKRELYVQVWYPGTLVEGRPAPRAKTMWQELYRGDLDFFTVFSRYLRAVPTHSYEDIPVAATPTPYPVIVFSHAMGSFAEQNTLLMEHLASHGYVVFALSHPYMSGRAVLADGKAIYPNFPKINDASAQAAAVDAELLPRIEQAGDAERAALHMQRYERATELAAIMAVWVDDLRFIVDSLDAPSDDTAALREFSGRVAVDRVGLLGMSFGGGAVTEFCKIDTRCVAAMNMDGGTYGQRQRQPLQVPYLAMVREGGRSLDYLLENALSACYRIEVAGATHLDFTDDPVVLPILKWLNLTGTIAAKRIVAITQIVSLRFFDAYLRGGPKPRFDPDLPELTVEMNDAARGA